MQPPRGIVPPGCPGSSRILLRLCDFSPRSRAARAEGARSLRSVTLEFNREPHADVAKAVRRTSRTSLDGPAAQLPFSKSCGGCPIALTGLPPGGSRSTPPPTCSCRRYSSPTLPTTIPDHKPRVDALLDAAHASRPRTRGSRATSPPRGRSAAGADRADGSFRPRAAHKKVQEVVFDQMGGFDAVGISIEGR